VRPTAAGWTACAGAVRLVAVAVWIAGGIWGRPGYCGESRFLIVTIQGVSTLRVWLRRQRAGFMGTDIMV
jgi:hypothetical protein